MTIVQLDLLDLLAEEEATTKAATGPIPWRHVPGFTQEHLTLDEIHRRITLWTDSDANQGDPKIYPDGRREWIRYHGWREAMWNNHNPRSLHPAHCFVSDTRCMGHGTMSNTDPDGAHHCVGAYLYRIYCSACDWWTPPIDGENPVTEAYADHCWPGWRNLPPVRVTPKGMDHVWHFPDDYPEEWKVPGAPTLDDRGPHGGTRHVPPGTYRTPFGGHSMSSVPTLMPAPGGAS